MGRDKPIFDEDEIAFNGRKDLEEDYETFRLTREKKTDFEFTKTAHRPYDLMVCAALLLADYTAPGALHISSDGNAADWQPARDWIRTSLGMDLQ